MRLKLSRWNEIIAVFLWTAHCINTLMWLKRTSVSFIYPSIIFQYPINAELKVTGGPLERLPAEATVTPWNSRQLISQPLKDKQPFALPLHSRTTTRLAYVFRVETETGGTTKPLRVEEGLVNDLPFCDKQFGKNWFIVLSRKDENRWIDLLSADVWLWLDDNGDKYVLDILCGSCYS